MNDIPQMEASLHTVLHRIREAERISHRTPFDVSLLAVSKKQSADKIRDAFSLGQRQFGENYVQEALQKKALLTDLSIEWHFIGSIQSNKTRLIAEQFDWVHSVNRFSIAERLNNQRPAHLPPLNICIEVNIDESPTKSGCLPDLVLALAKQIQTFDKLSLRGLMIIPDKTALNPFKKTNQLAQQLVHQGLFLDTLSMGMSDDFQQAIAEGSTIVRIGTAIFGAR